MPPLPGDVGFGTRNEDCRRAPAPESHMLKLHKASSELRQSVVTQGDVRPPALLLTNLVPIARWRPDADLACGRFVCVSGASSGSVEPPCDLCTEVAGPKQNARVRRV